MLEFAERIGWKLQKQDGELISEFCSKIGVEKRIFKVWLHNNKKNSTLGKRDQPTFYDILLECLIDKILSYLNYEEAAKMSILSKTWLQAWLTLPYLKFIVVSRKEINIVDKIMERYSDYKIPIVKFEFSNFSGYYYREVFSLIDKWHEIALRHGVKDLLYRGTSSYPLPISTILAAKSLRELILTRCNLMGISSCGVVTNCNSLRKLSLSNVSLDKNMLQTLLTSCPLIVAFILDFCSGLEKIELRNLQKIKSVSIGTRRNQRVKIQAPTLEHLSYSETCCEDPPMLEIVE
uniref:F-box/FBD/LRR-repeat protein At2g26030-like n=1 Tax=Nicotiana tabacum TaxID=4097 RepID=A0A1S4DDH7_TOBAC